MYMYVFKNSAKQARHLSESEMCTNKAIYNKEAHSFNGTLSPPTHTHIHFIGWPPELSPTAYSIYEGWELK